jgi:nicotinamidase-related amidase
MVPGPARRQFGLPEPARRRNLRGMKPFPWWSRVVFAGALPMLPVLTSAAPLQLTLQKRVETKPDSGEFRVVRNAGTWQPQQTAIIVCDMWDLHHCKNAVMRVREMAPRMNQVLEKARAQGVFIIHAPSSCTKFYEGHPARQRAQAAPKAANLPPDISQWCRQIPAEEKGKYPIDQTDGGEDDDPEEHAQWAAELKAKGLNPRAPWTRQIDVLKIHDADAISDSGVEIWNLLEQRGISNVILLGVHVNMCVAGRPFGLRQMAKNGKNVVLMRDMTDSMYNPKAWPYVDHYTGTDLFIEHVEKYICPTVTSDQILGGRPFRFSTDPRAAGE